MSDDLRYFVLEWSAPLTPPPVPGRAFVMLAAPHHIVRLLPAFVRAHGLAATLRTIAKLATRSRYAYCVVEGGDVVHLGWLTVGTSARYPVAPTDVVVGPSHTRRDLRGRGISPWAKGHAFDAMAARGYRVFRYHIAGTNLASLHSITKVGSPAEVDRPQ